MSSKLPTTLEQAKEFFTQKRKAGLVNVVTEMLVKDAAPEVTKDKMEPAKRSQVLADIDRAPTLKFSKINEFIDSQDFIKTELELAAENRVWKYIAKELGVDVLSSKKPEDVIKYRNWVKANASKFPKSFFTTGTFANAGTSAAKRNFYFTSAEDLNTFLEGVEFAKEDADIAEAVNRQTYVTGGADGKISDKFKKREFVIEVENEKNSDWNDFIKFQLTQDRTELLDTVSLNDVIKVSFNIKGRKWEKDGKINYFSNLEAWRIEKVASEDAPVVEEDEGSGLPF